MRSVQRCTVKPNGVVLKLFCGHERFLGGIAFDDIVNCPCLSCVPLQNDMGSNPSW